MPFSGLVRLREKKIEYTGVVALAKNSQVELDRVEIVLAFWILPSDALLNELRSRRHGLERVHPNAHILPEGVHVVVRRRTVAGVDVEFCVLHRYVDGLVESLHRAQKTFAGVLDHFAFDWNTKQIEGLDDCVLSEVGRLATLPERDLLLLAWWAFASALLACLGASLGLHVIAIFLHMVCLTTPLPVSMRIELFVRLSLRSLFFLRFELLVKRFALVRLDLAHRRKAYLVRLESVLVDGKALSIRRLKCAGHWRKLVIG